MELGSDKIHVPGALQVKVGVGRQSWSAGKLEMEKDWKWGKGGAVQQLRGGVVFAHGARVALALCSLFSRSLLLLLSALCVFRARDEERPRRDQDETPQDNFRWFTGGPAFCSSLCAPGGGGG